jgi:hypothetical protein
VVRTKNGENRVKKLGQPDVNDSIDLTNPPDSLEDLEADLMKRKMWRQARMNSMDMASESGDEVIRLIKNVTPIPT